VYRNSEKYSFPSLAFQYLNSITSLLESPMIGTEKPLSTREETPRTTPSSTPMEAIWSQDVPSCPASTGCPIWTPLSVTMPGTIVAVAEKLSTLPVV